MVNQVDGNNILMSWAKITRMRKNPHYAEGGFVVDASVAAQALRRRTLVKDINHAFMHDNLTFRPRSKSCLEDVRAEYINTNQTRTYGDLLWISELTAVLRHIVKANFCRYYYYKEMPQEFNEWGRTLAEFSGGLPGPLLVTANEKTRFALRLAGIQDFTTASWRID